MFSKLLINSSLFKPGFIGSKNDTVILPGYLIIPFLGQTLPEFNAIGTQDIFIQNKKNTSKMIDKFIEDLEDLKKAIENEDGKKLEEIFTKTKKIRKEIVEAGQDVEKPDFGRK